MKMLPGVKCSTDKTFCQAIEGDANRLIRNRAMREAPKNVLTELQKFEEIATVKETASNVLRLYLNQVEAVTP